MPILRFRLYMIAMIKTLSIYVSIFCRFWEHSDNMHNHQARLELRMEPADPQKWSCLCLSRI